MASVPKMALQHDMGVLGTTVRHVVWRPCGQNSMARSRFQRECIPSAGILQIPYEYLLNGLAGSICHTYSHLTCALIASIGRGKTRLIREICDHFISEMTGR